MGQISDAGLLVGWIFAFVAAYATYWILGGRFSGRDRQGLLTWGMTWRSVVAGIVSLAVLLITATVASGF